MEKVALPQQVLGEMHVKTWAGGYESLNLRIPQDQEIKRRCALSAFPPWIPFVTPALPGPGSDIRMRMGWKVKSKTEVSGVWFFPECRGSVVVVDFSDPHGRGGLGTEGIVSHGMVGS